MCTPFWMAATRCQPAEWATWRSCSAKISEIGVGKIASVSGRYFAMDRDRRWERSKKAFDAIVGISAGGAYADPIARVKECYHNGVTDEFVEPFVVLDAAGKAGWPAAR